MAPFELEPIPTPINLNSINEIGKVVRICSSPKADKNTLFKCLKVNKNTTTKLAMAYFKSLYYSYLYQAKNVQNKGKTLELQYIRKRRNSPRE